MVALCRHGLFELDFPLIVLFPSHVIKVQIYRGGAKFWYLVLSSAASQTL